MGIWAKWASCFLPNPLDVLLRKCIQEGRKSFLLRWDRELRDIPIFLYPFIFQIWEYIPDAQITLMTPPSLVEGIALLEGVELLVVESNSLEEGLERLAVEEGEFDVLIESPEPERWLTSWKAAPKLRWKEEWDDLAKPLSLTEKAICIYLGEKECGRSKEWNAFFRQVEEIGKKVVLFGNGVDLEVGGVIDRREEKGLLAVLSTVKNCCDFLIISDRNIFSMVYYLDFSFPMTILSVGKDFKRVEKKGGKSPNSALIHSSFSQKGRSDFSLPMQELLSELLKERSL